MNPVSHAEKLHAGVRPEEVEAYLAAHGHRGAKLIGLQPLGAAEQGIKVHGYGRPLIASFIENGRRREVVVRTMRPDLFGHDRRADRLDSLALAYDAFERYPKHVRALDLGIIDPKGHLTSIGEGEPFLITEYAAGELYAKDLGELAKRSMAAPIDLARAEALAEYLAELHAEQVDETLRRRAIRDLVGHGEGILGLIDSYAADDPVATPARLRALEHHVVDWRWRLRDVSGRARRTHGDFHPFNLLFREGTDFSVLDASRGGAGDPADDVACLSINYLFFALVQRGRFDGALREAWDVFFRAYFSRTRDADLLEVIAPYYAWRALVLASPAWYPDVAPSVRDRLLRFVEGLLAGADFTPARVDALLGSGSHRP
jgi:aminoglycoside phosphotransferase (APT) family kinase protein